jgi:hypothetical protein
MAQENPHGIPDTMIKDWLEVRKAKKAKMTPTAWNMTNSVLSKLKENGLDPVECFGTMVASGWQGIKLSYFQREIDALSSKQKYPTKDEREAIARETKRREEEASRAKEIEIQRSRVTNFTTLKKCSGFSEALAKAKKEMNRLGMSEDQYHRHILSNSLPEVISESH